MTYYDELIAARDVAIERNDPQAPGLAVAVHLYRCWEAIGGHVV